MGTNLFDESIESATDYRQLNEWERKILIQKFIDIIHYDSEKFRKAVRIIKTWEKISNNKN